MPAWVHDGVEEYRKRLPRDFSLEFVELPLGHRGKNPDIQKAKQQEADAILGAIQANEKVVCLEVGGKSWSTEQLAKQAEHWRQDGQNIALVIGGPDGLSQSVLAKAQQLWSLSPLTLPHPLVRVLVSEQLYRAWTILMNHPYHK